MALGDTTSYKRLYMKFLNEAGKTVNITIDNPKTFADGDYADINAQDAAIESVMDTIISKNIFTTSGGNLTEKVDARIVEYTSEDAMDVG